MGNTLLSYAVSANQDPIEVSPQTGDPSKVTLMIVVSNPSGHYINCQSIDFGFLQGTSARDFFSDPIGIGTTAPAGWKLTQSGATFTAKPEPPGSGQIGPSGLTFVLSSITVNNEPGTTPMTITETTIKSDGSASVATLAIPLAKFPAQFNVGQLLATPRAINQGENTTLSWNGSGGATYELQYVDENSNTVTITKTTDGQPLPSSGNYTIINLRASTTFYLLVTLSLPGQDSPLTFQREASVSVAIPPVEIKSFSASATSVSMPGDTVTFNWEVLAATQVQLNGKNVGGTSTTEVVNETTTFTLQALGQGGPVTSSITVTVNPVAITSFTANPNVVYGQNNQVPVTLAWAVQSASQLILNDSVVTGTGAVIPVNDATTFTLEATGYPRSVYQSLTVSLEDVNLKVWVRGDDIYCSFGANVGIYTAILLITYKMSGLNHLLVTTGTYGTKVSTPGVIQFSINISAIPGFITVTAVDVNLTGFPSGAITGSYPS